MRVALRVEDGNTQRTKFVRSGFHNNAYRQALEGKVTQAYVFPVLDDISPFIYTDGDDYDVETYRRLWRTVRRPITSETVLEFNEHGWTKSQVTLNAKSNVVSGFAPCCAWRTAKLWTQD